MFHAALDLSPYRVLPVEERRIVGNDEELAVGAVRIVRPGHGCDSADVWLAREFGLEVGEIGTVIAGAGRVAALCHKARDDPMEHDPVVEAAFCEAGNALDMVGRKIRAKADDDVAAGRKGQSEGFGLRHGELRRGMGEVPRM